MSTPHQKRVEATERELRRRFGAFITVSEFAAWHLRHGGRAPGERCKTCRRFDQGETACIDCTHSAYDNWLPKGGRG